MEGTESANGWVTSRARIALLVALPTLFGCPSANPRTTAYPLPQGNIHAGLTVDVPIRGDFDDKVGRAEFFDPRVRLGDRQSFVFGPNVSGDLRVGLGAGFDVGAKGSAFYGGADLKFSPLRTRSIAIAVQPGAVGYWFDAIASIDAPLLVSLRLSPGAVLTLVGGWSQFVHVASSNSESTIGGMLHLGVGVKLWTARNVAMLLELGDWIPMTGPNQRRQTHFITPSLSFQFGDVRAEDVP